MASAQSPETSDIRRRGRQRLIGAIAIAVLLVVFVPMILDSEPRNSRTTPALEIPPRKDAPALPPPIPAAASKAAPEAAKPAPEPVKLEPAPSPKAEPPKKAEPVPAPPPKAEPKAAAAPRLEGFAVQVGAFKDEDKLKQARDKLAAARIAHYIERIESSGGLTRLRAGPYATREAADKGLAAVKGASLEGKVVPLP
jgi:DedD protein